MTVMGVTLGILCIALFARWLLIGGDESPPYSSRRRR